MTNGEILDLIAEILDSSASVDIKVLGIMELVYEECDKAALTFSAN